MEITNELLDDVILKKYIPKILSDIVSGVADRQGMQEEFIYKHNNRAISVRSYAYTIVTSNCQRCGKHAKCTCATSVLIGKYNSTYRSSYICRPCYEELRIIPDLAFYDSLT